jgi:hypothetical protein
MLGRGVTSWAIARLRLRLTCRRETGGNSGYATTISLYSVASITVGSRKLLTTRNRIIRESADPEHLISANGFCLFAINLYKDDIKLVFPFQRPVLRGIGSECALRAQAADTERQSENKV